MAQALVKLTPLVSLCFAMKNPPGKGGLLGQVSL